MMNAIQSIPVSRELAAVLNRILQLPNVNVSHKGLAADYLIQNDFDGLTKLEADIIKGEKHE